MHEAPEFPAKTVPTIGAPLLVQSADFWRLIFENSWSLLPAAGNQRFRGFSRSLITMPQSVLTQDKYLRRSRYVNTRQSRRNFEAPEKLILGPNFCMKTVMPTYFSIAKTIVALFLREIALLKSFVFEKIPSYNVMYFFSIFILSNILQNLIPIERGIFSKIFSVFPVKICSFVFEIFAFQNFQIFEMPRSGALGLRKH